LLAWRRQRGTGAQRYLLCPLAATVKELVVLAKQNLARSTSH
jgi:hypothetical protein